MTLVTLQARWKAVAGLLGGFLSPLVTLYVANQNLTLKEIVTSIVTGLITGVTVHQVVNKK